MMTISRASSERIYEILEEKSDIVSPDNGICDIPDGSVQFENVSFSYSEKAEKPVLDCINLDIKSGETIGIIGMTGSAKTSLVQLIPRLYDTTKASSRSAELMSAIMTLSAARRGFNGTSEESAFLRNDKGKFALGNENASDEELERVCRLACADEFIREFSDGYDSHLNRRRKCLGRSEAASLYRPRSFEKTKDTYPRRLYFGGRYPYRRKDTQGFSRRNTGYHKNYHRSEGRIG